MHASHSPDATTQINPELPLQEQLKSLFEHKGVTTVAMAQSIGIARQTIAKALDAKADSRLSTVLSIFEELGYKVVPVPAAMATEVAAFINNGGQVTSLPAGTVAPLGVAQAAFRDASVGLSRESA